MLCVAMNKTSASTLFWLHYLLSRLLGSPRSPPPWSSLLPHMTWLLSSLRLPTKQPSCPYGQANGPHCPLRRPDSTLPTFA